METDASMTLEERLKIIDDEIARKKMIADGLPLTPFTTKENMRVYDCVYVLCTQKPPNNHCGMIYEKYLYCFKERIKEKVLPALLEKQGAALLTEVTQMWSEYTAFMKSVSKLFEFLDRFYIPGRGLLSLNEAPKHYFRDMVCDELYGKFQEETMNLIMKEREGNRIDRGLLKAVLNFFQDMGGKGTVGYYDKFEQIMLAEAAAYYSHLSMEWWFWRDSLANHLRKVDWCLIQEEGRAEVYPRQTTKTKLLEVMRYILLERNAKKLAEKKKVESHNLGADVQELMSKYDSLNFEEDGFTAVPMASQN